MGAHGVAEQADGSIGSEYIRPGHIIVTGKPYPGERVFLTPASCLKIWRPRWFLVHRVEAAYLPEYNYLHGRYCDHDREPDRVYARIDALRVERRG